MGQRRRLYVIRYTLHVTRYTVYVIRCMLQPGGVGQRMRLYVIRYTLYVTRYTLHVTRYTLYVIRHASGGGWDTGGEEEGGGEVHTFLVLCYIYKKYFQCSLAALAIACNKYAKSPNSHLQGTGKDASSIDFIRNRIRAPRMN